MRRISKLIALFCLAVISQKSFAQCANPATSSLTYQSGGIFDAINGTTVASLTLPSNNTSSVYSGIYYTNTTITNLNVRFTAHSAGSGGNSSNPTSYIITIKSGVNGTNTVSTCTFNSPLSQIPVSNTNIYFTIPASSLPTGTNFQVQLTVSLSNSGKDLLVTDFAMEAGNGAIQKANAALPVSFLGLEAKKVSNGTQLTWKVAQEEGVVNYALERSVDGKNFSTVGTIAASGSSSYSLTDNQLSTSTAYYRVRNNDKDGRFKYSTTIKVEAGKVSFLKKAYPMPAVNEVFVQHDAAAAGAVITLTAQDGRVIRRIQAQTGTMQTRIDLSGLNSGLYMVRYDDGTSNAESLKVVKQ